MLVNNSFLVLCLMFVLMFLFLGTPVNRVPIMAKQTLDLFKLFKLVVEKGGLVEVGNDVSFRIWGAVSPFCT